MAKNLSVTQFKTLMERIPKDVGDDLEAVVSQQASRLATAMAHNVPKGVDGRQELLESIRVEPGAHRLRKLVRAGGPLTTRAVREGVSATYDYAHAQEFGTAKMKAQPFFWPTYRQHRKAIRSAIKKAAAAAMVKAWVRGP